MQNLLTIARLKAVAHSVYIKEIVQREDLLKILMYEKAKIHAQRIPELVKTFAPSLKFAADPKGPYFTYRLGANSRKRTGNSGSSQAIIGTNARFFVCGAVKVLA